MKMKILFLTVLIGVLAASHASAQSNMGLKAIGGRVAFVNPEDLNSTAGFGAFADLGTISTNFGLEAHVDYWSQSEEITTTKSSVHDIAFGPRAKYMFELQNTSLRPFIGAGVSVHFLNAKVSDSSDPSLNADDSSTKFGLDVGGGMATHLTEQIDFRTEAWYVMSDMNQFALSMGLAMKLGS
jgi:opacity protein-like surface antigen